MALRTFEDVDKWVEGKGPNGVEKLRGRLAIGAIAGTNAVTAKAWLERHDRIAAGEALTKEQDTAQRAALAAEVSASAAVASARWAKWATVAAVAALVVSAWPYIKDVGR